MTDYGTTDRLTGGTPSASGILGGYPASQACDDNAATRWISNSAAFPHWWKYDFGAGVSWKISKITIKGAIVDTHIGIKDFSVQGSNNDTDYTTLYTGQTVDNENLQTFNFTADNKIAYRYIKINITTSWDTTPNDQNAEIWEFRAFEGIYPSGAFMFFT